MFLAIALMLAITGYRANAQSVTLQRDSLGYSFCKIRPVLAKLGDVDSARQLTVSTFNDNQIDYATIYYELRSRTDDGSTVVRRGNYELKGEDYAAWGDKNYLYNYVANKLKITIIN